MRFDSRKATRVRLDHRHPVHLMAVDGTWQRPCVLLDVSVTGARIEVEGTLDVLQAREFFLLLSSTGLAFRRCELIWIDGPVAGIHFVTAAGKRAKALAGHASASTGQKPAARNS